eukprot:CAMPEP_0196667884 /NCGR_PEP_ID=MMETSP1086-20130531/65324_1 /TAXON_ID=77921 /ORGANISM="Cyanoptyche  gloeocystis , Strain SAG4.97" /LENGTH=196 /DNA_ID=CAMNT_0042005249 /DNA_START=229 /DNA_END=819 /DNA_ORIENTATION=-
MPGKAVLDSGTLDFPSAREAMRSPLAKSLFQIEGVKGVFFGQDFVTVTKDEESDWQMVKVEVFSKMADFYGSGQPIVLDAADLLKSDTAIHPEDSETVAMIKELLETRIRPAVQDDGGDISFRGFKDGIVYVKLQGSCSSCPSSTVTLKSGIENMMMHYVPEVTAVEAVVDEEDKLLESTSDAQLRGLEEKLKSTA